MKNKSQDIYELSPLQEGFLYMQLLSCYRVKLRPYKDAQSEVWKCGRQKGVYGKFLGYLVGERRCYC